METYYLIDFENVSTGGFSGCELLGSTDHIHVFFTDKSTKFDLNILHRHKAASLDIHKVPCGNQSADMHIVSFLGYLVGLNRGKPFQCVIVSKDTDFDNVIKYWTDAENADVKRASVIKETKEPKNRKTKKNGNSQKNDDLSTRETRNKKTENKAGNEKKKTDTKSDDSSSDRKALSDELKKAIAESEISPCFTDQITSIVTSHYEDKNMLTSVHNELRQIFTDYNDVYDLVKKVVRDHKTVTVKDKNVSTGLNVTVQKDLSKADYKNDVVNYVASLTVKYSGKDNSKALANKALVKKYGQDLGNNLYKKIKKYL